MTLDAFMLRVFGHIDIRRCTRISTLAALVGIAASWASSSLLPLTVAALLIALLTVATLHVQTLNLARGTRLLADSTYPPTPLTMTYDFMLGISEATWEPLGLTPEERAIVAGHQSWPIGFTVEFWGQSLIRWRMRELEGERIHERIIDRYHPRGIYDIVHLWDLPLSAEVTPETRHYPWPRLELVWRDGAGVGGETVTLCGFEGRFGGSYDPDGKTEPAPEATLLRVPLPLLPPIPSNSWFSDAMNPDAMNRFRLRGKEAAPWAGEGCYVYYSDQTQEKGLWWRLVCRDLRPMFDGEVIGVPRDERDEGARIQVRLFRTGHMLWAKPSTIESDENGRRMPRMGETVRVILDDACEKPECIWLTGFPRQ